MLLKDVVVNYYTLDKIDGNLNIESIEFDSKKVKQNSMYVCLNNEKCQNRINEALKNGAKVVVVDRNCVYINDNVVKIIVDDVREAFSYFCANFEGNPQNSLKIIGVVGTNGKTSTCHILKHIISSCGKKVAVIGTLGVLFEDYSKSATLTTPDPSDLFKILSELKQRGCEYVCMEVSAHAIFFKKTAPIKFESLIFTNCTQDHLDFFENFEDYYKVKKSIFTQNNSKSFVVNIDDNLGRELVGLNNVTSYGIENPSDVFAIDIAENKSGVGYVLNLHDNIFIVKMKIIGLFNVYNSLAAATCCFDLGFNPKSIAFALKSMPCVSGRMEKIAEKNDVNFYVDYAHTPDGLEKSLLSLRKATTNNLIVIFGCGGNRDISKRQIMGRIAGDLADYVIITSDNPRFEDPQKIMREIEIGVRDCSRDYIMIEKRKDAISYALRVVESGDSVLIAGKGAEEYQDVMGVKTQYNDKECLLSLINND